MFHFERRRFRRRIGRKLFREMSRAENLSLLHTAVQKTVAHFRQRHSELPTRQVFLRWSSAAPAVIQSHRLQRLHPPSLPLPSLILSTNPRTSGLSLPTQRGQSTMTGCQKNASSGEGWAWMPRSSVERVPCLQKNSVRYSTI